MFLVFGAAPDDRVTAFITSVNPFTRCDACFAATAAKLSTTDNRAPTPARFISMYHDVSDVTHHHHVGQTAKETSVGFIEKFWHHDAVQLIEPYFEGDKLAAEFVATDMWWCEFPGTAEFVITEMNTRGTTWIPATKSFLATIEDVPGLVQKAWARARKRETYGMDMLTPEELELTGPARVMGSA
jgi:hypothetical protein